MIHQAKLLSIRHQVVVLASLMIAGLTGCGDSPSEMTLPISLDGMTAEQLFSKVRAAYRDARSYTDNATIVEYAIIRSTGSESTTPYTRMSLAWEEPNKLRLRYEDAVASSQGRIQYDIASDGVTVRSAVSEFPEQIHEAIAPLKLTSENFILESALRSDLLKMGLENLFPQLELLLSENKEKAVFPQDSQLRMLPKKQLDDTDYFRLQTKSPAGNRILWIDKDDFSLRRMELPIEAQLGQLNPNSHFSKLAIWIDFQDVTINTKIDTSSFEMQIPDGARRVRRFVPPPPPGPPSFLGKAIGDFVFSTLDGKKVTPESLEDRVTVLDFWGTNCPPCKLYTPVLEQVVKKYEESKEVAFYAVSTDPSHLPDSIVAETLKSWGGTMPVLRDLKNTSYHNLNVRSMPTLILLGRDRTLQAFMVGAHRNPEPLAGKIDLLVHDVDLATQALEDHKQMLEQYEEALNAATIKNSIVEVAIARPDILPQNLPENFQVEKLWQCDTDTVAHPGDLLVVEDSEGEAARVLALDGGQTITELDLIGEMIGRHELPQHEERAGGFIRSTVDATGRRWTLVSGVGWQQIYLLDDQWQTALILPDEQHSGIGDILLGDLTNSGTPIMYVGYWGGLGVQGGSLDGRRLWSNRRLSHVLQITPGSLNAEGVPTVWCTSTRGTLLQITPEGKPLSELYVTGKSLMYVARSTSDVFCGLAVEKVGQYSAIGFSTTGSVEWEYELPPGEYVQQVPRIQAVQLPGQPECWQVVAADGSIHWLDAEGELIDRFNYGELLTGIAITSQEGATKLMVATEKNLTAWKIRELP